MSSRIAASCLALAVCGCGAVPTPKPAASPPLSREHAAAEPTPPLPRAAAGETGTGVPASQAAPKAKAPARSDPKRPPDSAALTSTARPASPAAAPLDLKSLERRLKETEAIGVLAKLSLKNQVDDLIARFKAFHDGRQPPTLSQLRPSFELLLMKVLALLQDKDTALARDIHASREAIWRVLADQDQLASYK